MSADGFSSPLGLSFSDCCQLHSFTGELGKLTTQSKYRHQIVASAALYAAAVSRICCAISATSAAANEASSAVAAAFP